MSAIQTRYEHVELDEKGVPMITGTSMKVIELALEQTEHGWSPEELHFQHPYLSLGQIYSALAYYWDHKDELDQDIEQRFKASEQVRYSVKPSDLTKRLNEKRSQ